MPEFTNDTLSTRPRKRLRPSQMPMGKPHANAKSNATLQTASVRSVTSKMSEGESSVTGFGHDRVQGFEERSAEALATELCDA